MHFNSAMTQKLGLILALIVLTAGPGCSKKKRTPPAQPAPVTETKEEEVPDPVTDLEKDIGETVPPVSDTVVVIETGDKPSKKHLLFNASGATEEGRYLTEFLMVVRATSESCIRLKVRPSPGIDSQVSDENIQGVTDVGECEDYPIDDKPKAAPAPEPAAAALADLSFHPTPNFNLAGASAALCSFRLFRMPGGKPRLLGQPNGLGPVVTKTARLGAISAGKLARVWVDDEVGNICGSGSVGNLPITDFGPIAQFNSGAYPNGYIDDKDQLRVEHLQNIASEAERIIKTLTTSYGPVSDIDKNGGIDIIISPDVNRRSFVPFTSTDRDSFRAELIYKPEDLANYNSTSNPTSNEGEVVYLWAPDPAGIYNYGSFSSSNSLTGNYSKGYIGTQIMNLINFNSHLLVLKGKAEKQWLIESLALLASSYVAGNSYSGASLGHYLGSRPQAFSLTEPLKGGTDTKYLGYDQEGQLGMRAMFGWYLHTILCDAVSVAPCAKIKELIETSKVGTANVEAVVGKDFAKILENFGASVGVSMADDPTAVRKLFTADAVDLPAVVTMPQLTEILKTSPPQTFEITHDAAGSSGGADRAVAGPFTSYDSLLFQSIYPDNDKDIKLEKNSVTYILLTGLIDPETDVTAHLGPNLNVAVVPLGDRNGAIRRIHEEKLSESADLDLRPVNLTQLQDRNRTYFGPPQHSEPFDANYSREIWAVGSIDNYKVNVEGTPTDIGDSDTYNISVDPCAGAPDEANCRAQGFAQIIVQVIPQDFHKQLEPMSIMTTTDLGMFRGRVMWGRLVEADHQFTEPESVTSIICQSEYGQGGILNTATAENCSNGGVTPAKYKTNICDKYVDSGICPISLSFPAGRYIQSTTFDHYTYSQYIAANSPGPSYDNFLHSGPYRYPYYAHNTMSYKGEPEEKSGTRTFLAEEAHRQFFNFTFSKKLKANIFQFFPIWAGFGTNILSLPDLDIELQTLSDTEISDLLFVRTKIVAATYPTIALEIARYVETCKLYKVPEADCLSPLPASMAVVDNLIRSFLATHKKSVLCRPGESLPSGACPGRNLGGDLTNSLKWIEAKRIIEYASSNAANTLETYYDPVFPLTRGTHCSGEEFPGRVGTICSVSVSPGGMRANDIRAQLNVPTESLQIAGCFAPRDKFLTDFLACGDQQAFNYKFRGDEGLPFSFIDQALSTSRPRERGILAGHEAGELAGFPNRYHLFYVKVPTAKASIVHVIIGGLDLSQGKYILRARSKDFSKPFAPK
jgi:hypothetical protein